MIRNGLSCSEAGKIGGEKAKEMYKKKKLEKIQLYNKNPKLCPYCCKPIPYEKRYNKFCCASHAATYSNIHRDHSIYEKQANTLHKYFSENIVIIDKENKCTKIITNINDIKKYRPKKFCKFCGCDKGKCIDSYVCKKHQIFKSLEKFGFDKNSIGSIKVVNEFYRIKNIIYNFYKDHVCNDNELKKYFGYTSGSSNFHKLLKTLDIKLRTAQESQKLSLLNGNNNINKVINNYKYKSECHTTWYGKKVYLRSSYESDFANILDEKKIYYTVEKIRIKYFDTQKNKERIAIPDFYLVDFNIIVEIKSSYTLDIQNMKDKMVEYQKNGYGFKLILDHKEVNIFDL